MKESDEPRVDVRIGGSRIKLLGTAHVSRTSAERVRELLEGGGYAAVAVELCPSRYQALIDPDALSRMDLFSMIREGRVYMVVASLALAAYQKRLADQLGIEPGAEQRMAIRLARERGLPVLLIDREIGVTLRRVGANVTWWRRLGLFSGLLAALVSREPVEEAEIEQLKEGDVLETALAEFAASRKDLFLPLIEERDRYMAARLREEVTSQGPENLLAVLGAGHLKGVERYLEQDRRDPKAVLAELDRLPEKKRWPRLIPWAIVLLILAGFGYGFSRSSELGWRVIGDWVLINGSLSALGALAAAAHPLTVLTAFVAAPITSLNPTIGAGMVAGAAELYLRRPSVGDFGRLRQDTTEIRGWWRNRVSRVLLVFILSTLGSAIGTYAAGFRIFDRLFG